MFIKQSGVTLVEVLVTLLITTVGLLGLAALQLGALKATSESAQRSQAVWLMQDLVERIRANPRGKADEYVANTDCSNYPDPMCAAYINTSGTKFSAANCSASQMAVFDRWETQCQYSTDSTIIYTSRDSILSVPNANILTLTETNDVDKAELNLTASWLLRGKVEGAISTIDDAFEQEIQR